MNCVIVSSVIQLKYMCVVHSSDVLCGLNILLTVLWKSFEKQCFWTSHLVWFGVFGRLIELIILLAGFGYPLLQGWKLWKSFVKSRLKECF